jgi:hypothetical protein
LDRFTVVLGSDQGDINFGAHGMGVSTPLLACVAANTVGFACDVQFPKVGSTAGVPFSALSDCAVAVITVGNPMATVHGERPLSHIHFEPTLTINVPGAATEAASSDS